MGYSKGISHAVIAVLIASLALASPLSTFVPNALARQQVQITEAEPLPYPAPTIDEDDVIEAYEEIYEGLFRTPFDENNSGYFPSETFTEPGVYDGINDVGQPFTLDVWEAYQDTAWLEDPSLDPDVKDFAISSGLTLVEVEGSISTSLAAYEIFGTLAFWQDDDAGTQIHFLPNYYLDLLPEESQEAQIQEGPQFGDEVEIHCVTIIFPCILPTPECQACFDAYDDAVEDAMDEYEDALDQAQQTYDNAVADAAQDFQDCKDDAAATMAICTGIAIAGYYAAIGVCALLGIFGPACLLSAIAARTVAIAGCAANLAYQNYVCDREYDQALDRAQRDLDQATENANNELDEDLAEAQEDLEDCLDQNGCYGICEITICWIRVIGEGIERR